MTTLELDLNPGVSLVKCSSNVSGRGKRNILMGLAAISNEHISITFLNRSSDSSIE